MNQQVDPQDEHALEIDSSHIGLWLTMYAIDLEQDEALDIRGSFFQSRRDFHQQLHDFVWNEPSAQRYKLVKILDQGDEEKHDE